MTSFLETLRKIKSQNPSVSIKDLLSQKDSRNRGVLSTIFTYGTYNLLDKLDVFLVFDNQILALADSLHFLKQYEKSDFLTKDVIDNINNNLAELLLYTNITNLEYLLSNNLIDKARLYDLSVKLLDTETLVKKAKNNLIQGIKIEYNLFNTLYLLSHCNKDDYSKSAKNVCIFLDNLKKEKDLKINYGPYHKNEIHLSLKKYFNQNEVEYKDDCAIKNINFDFFYNFFLNYSKKNGLFNGYDFMVKISEGLTRPSASICYKNFICQSFIYNLKENVYDIKTNTDDVLKYIKTTGDITSLAALIATKEIIPEKAVEIIENKEMKAVIESVILANNVKDNYKQQVTKRI